jgi:hypothetical protein
MDLYGVGTYKLYRNVSRHIVFFSTFTKRYHNSHDYAVYDTTLVAVLNFYRLTRHTTMDKTETIFASSKAFHYCQMVIYRQMHVGFWAKPSTLNGKIYEDKRAALILHIKPTVQQESYSLWCDAASRIIKLAARAETRLVAFRFFGQIRPVRWSEVSRCLA